MLRRLLLSIVLVHLAFGYVFDCLDGCECDTEDEVVHCHDGKRTKLHLPEGQRLRGFPVIGLTYNDIVRLPDEEVLLSKFPDLAVVDVERNPNFDCNSLNDYSKVKIVSDCFKNVSEISRVPKLYRPTKDCDVACQASRHYAKLHEYVLSLWEVLKEKYENFDFDATMKVIQEFFTRTMQKINTMGKELHEDLTSPKSHPKQLVTPIPELQPVD
ncbi:unnamed protein product [Caenorhabditis auriculariae]|uniref:Uncharacterized protein n=1 Tax=Caenorhabditis auriculariae TaxID=2777116 RepID=A0A8S1HK86_9PELO|nr:unnamed protein product [Caenorhabditis auriculariae]